MKSPEALRLVAKLAAFFPPVPEATQVAYASELEPFQAGEIEIVFDVVIQHSKRFPSIAEILEMAHANRRWSASNNRALQLEDSLAASPAEIRVMLQGYAERMAERTAEALTPGDTPEQILERLKALPVTGAGGRLEVRPEGRLWSPKYERKGPPCPLDGKKTWQDEDSGRYFWCDCGWLMDRTA